MSTVLVVDDELKIARLIRDYLEQAGFVVATASDGKSAIASARQLKPDLIAAEQLPLIFERFAKGADSHGTGLGLSIARELIRAHGGEMTAASIVGQGTTIEFSIPRFD